MLELFDVVGKSLGYRDYGRNKNEENDVAPGPNPFVLGGWVEYECRESYCNFENGVGLDTLKIADLGMFVSGGDPFIQDNLASLTGKATYAADINGWIFREGLKYGSHDFRRDAHSSADGISSTLRLNVDFSDKNNLGTIEGTVGYGLSYDGRGASVGGGTIILESTNIGNTNSGFFEGNVSGSIKGREYEGKWGGQFYGNNSPDGLPEHVAGTISATNKIKIDPLNGDKQETIMFPWVADKHPYP